MKILKRVCVILGLLISVNAMAVKVAVVEVQRIFAESKQAKNYQQELEEEFAPREKVLQGKEAELQLKVRDYEKNRLVWSDEKAKGKEGELIKLRQKYQQYGQKLQEELKQKQQKNIRTLELKVEEVVEKIAEKKGYELVLFQGIAYHKKSLNITQEVLDIINKE